MPIAASGSGSSALPLVFLLLIVAAMYFFMIRPQQRRSREVQRMQSTLGPGDEIMTSSGIYGEVLEVDDEEGTVTLEIAPEVSIKIARGAVGKVVVSAAGESSAEATRVETPTEPESDTQDDRVIERRKD